MRNKKVILSSILSLVLCLSLIAGGTFALFTHQSETSIAITSGKVEVVATIENLDVYSPEKINQDGTIAVETDNAVMTDDYSGVFVNGGSATLEGAKLTLDKMTPGDKATFQIKITNNSNVAVMYRSIIMTTEDSGLFSGLKVTIGEIYDGTTQYSAWTPLSVEEKEIVLDCSVELPATAGNTYQETSCAMVFAVEAVQGNAATTDAVARIGETEFATLEGAVSAVDEGQTIEIIRPGTYAPFTIGVNNVTVKGIIGESKAESTVIKNTAKDRIILGSGTIADDSNPTAAEIHKLTGVDGVTLENLWIDSTATPALNSWDLDMAVIISAYYEQAYRNSTNVTINGCYIEGDGAQTMTMGLGDGLTFTNNVVKNFGTAFYAETNAIKTQTISGNIFEGVKNAVSYVMYNGGQADITIANNTVVDSTTFTIWDYAQWQNRNSAEAVASGFKNFTVSGNNGNINYNLTHFNYKTATPGSVTVGTGEQSINYINGVAFDIPAADKANYTITNTDGSALDRTTQGRSVLEKEIMVDGVNKAACYELAFGEYLLVDNNTGKKYYFTVTDPVVGTQQYVTLDTVVIASAEDMFAFADDVNVNGNSYLGKTVKLMADINLDNKAWTPVGATGSTTFAGSFDGNEKTISNLNIDTTAIGRENVAAAGLFGWIENHSDTYPTVISNLTVNGATVNSGKYAGVLVGYTTANCTIEDCKVVNANVSGTRSGAISGYQDNTVVVTGCSVDTAKITGTDSVGEIVGYAQKADLITDCKADNVQLFVAGQEAFETAISNKQANINLTAGNYTMINTDYDVTVTGDKTAVLSLPANVHGSGNTITFDGITIQGYDKEDTYYTTQLNGANKAIYKNCTIKGLIVTYCDSDFTACVFENTFNDQYSVFDYGAKVVSITDCTFNTPCSKAVKLYNEGPNAATLNVTNCKFIAATTDKAAVEIDSTYATEGYTVNISGCEKNEFYTKLWNDKGTNSTVTVDSVQQ